jgi:excisionase family DNA binding protein
MANTPTTLNKKILTKLNEIELLLKKINDHTQQQTSKPLTFREACAYLGYAPSYLYKLTYKNIVPHYKPTGKMVFFSKNELDEWIFKGNSKLRIENAELKDGKNIEKDPNQVEMFEKQEKEKLNEGKKKKLDEEVWIEFPLKSRRKK